MAQVSVGSFWGRRLSVVGVNPGWGQGQGWAEVRLRSVALTMDTKALTHPDLGCPVFLLWLLLLLPLATSGQQRSPFTPAPASGETFERDAPTSAFQQLAPGAPGAWVALGGVNKRHYRARGPDCGQGPSDWGHRSLISSLSSPTLDSLETTQHVWISSGHSTSWFLVGTAQET